MKKFLLGLTVVLILVPFCFGALSRTERELARSVPILEILKDTDLDGDDGEELAEYLYDALIRRDTILIDKTSKLKEMEDAILDDDMDDYDNMKADLLGLDAKIESLETEVEEFLRNKFTSEQVSRLEALGKNCNEALCDMVFCEGFYCILREYVDAQ